MTDARPQSDDIRDLFNRIAPVYDQLNQSLSGGLHRIWKQMTVQWSGAQSGMTALDVCCGSGDLTLLLARAVGPNGSVVGADFAVEQLKVAAERATLAVLTTPMATPKWVEADALTLPFEDAAFDAITMGYGLRNLTQPDQGLREMYRVLRPGGRAAILDFHRPAQPMMQRFQRWYLETVVVPAASRCGLTDEYAYIGPSLDRFLLGAEQVALAQSVGFSHVVHYPIMGGMMGVLVASR